MSLEHQDCRTGLVPIRFGAFKEINIKMIGEKEVLQKAMFQDIFHGAFSFTW